MPGNLNVVKNLIALFPLPPRTIHRVAPPVAFVLNQKPPFMYPHHKRKKIMPAYDLGNKVYVGQSSHTQKFVDSINVDSVCNACSGKLVHVEVVHFGLGGALKIKFQCQHTHTHTHSHISRAELIKKVFPQTTCVCVCECV